MQNFTIQEIQEKINFHKEQFDRFNSIANDEKINYAGFFVQLDKCMKVAVIGPGKKTEKILRDFFYDMADFHRIELWKWEQAKGIDPVVNS